MLNQCVKVILSRTPWEPVADPLWSADPSLKTAGLVGAGRKVQARIAKRSRLETSVIQMKVARLAPSVKSGINGRSPENAGLENGGPKKSRGWKMQDWKMTDESAGLENDGLEK